MKYLILPLLITATLHAHAGTVELGKYRAVDADTKTITASFDIKANGTLTFYGQTPMFSISCNGRYTIRGNEFSSDLVCDSLLASNVSVKIDITAVNANSVRSINGALVDVVIDIIGDEPVKYILKKVN